MNERRSVAGQDVVEPWWCPVCNGAAHRTRRPGRPRLYCTNACRQRAYRWRRDHHARTVATPAEPVPSAFIAFGRFHAAASRLATSSPSPSDRRSRRPTVCGVFAAPSRGHIGRRTHYDFLFVSPRSCRRCADLVAPPIDPLAPVNRLPPPPAAVGALDDATTTRLSDQRRTMLTSATKRTSR